MFIKQRDSGHFRVWYIHPFIILCCVINSFFSSSGLPSKVLDCFLLVALPARFTEAAIKWASWKMGNNVFSSRKTQRKNSRDFFFF